MEKTLLGNKFEGIAMDSQEQKHGHPVEGEGLEPPTAAAENASSQKRMEPLWGDGRSPDPSRICTARRTNGEPCRKVAIRGATVCRTHGGAAPQVKAKARARLEMAADRMAEKLLGIATDENAPYPVKLAAIRDALDRAGVTSKTAVDVEVNLKPWEQVFESISRDTGHGEPSAYERLALAAGIDPSAESDVVDAEVVYTPHARPTGPQTGHAYPPGADAAEAAPWAGVPGTLRLPAAGASDARPVTGDDAITKAAEMNRRAGALPVLYNPRRR